MNSTRSSGGEKMILEDSSGLTIPQELPLQGSLQPIRSQPQDLRYYNECMESLQNLFLLSEAERNYVIIEIYDYIDRVVQQKLRRVRRKRLLGMNTWMSRNLQTYSTRTHPGLVAPHTRAEDQDVSCYILKDWTVIRMPYKFCISLRGALLDRRTRRLLNKDFRTTKVTSLLTATRVRTVDCEYILEGTFIDPQNVIPKEIKVHFQDNEFPVDWRKVCEEWHSVIKKSCINRNSAGNKDEGVHNRGIEDNYLEEYYHGSSRRPKNKKFLEREQNAQLTTSNRYFLRRLASKTVETVSRKELSKGKRKPTVDLKPGKMVEKKEGRILGKRSKTKQKGSAAT